MSHHEPSPPLLLIRLERAGLRKIIFSVLFMLVCLWFPFVYLVCFRSQIRNAKSSISMHECVHVCILTCFAILAQAVLQLVLNGGQLRFVFWMLFEFL